jgi:dienelactone hydrolase
LAQEVQRQSGTEALMCIAIAATALITGATLGAAAMPSAPQQTAANGRGNYNVVKHALLGLSGNDDENPNKDQVNRTEVMLKRLGKTYEFHRYGGAGHAFFNIMRASYRPEQAADGWAKVFAFLRKHLAA